MFVFPYICQKIFKKFFLLNIYPSKTINNSIMKKLILFILAGFICSSSFAQIDDINEYIKAKKTMLIMAVNKEARAICKRKEVKFIERNSTIETGGIEINDIESGEAQIPLFYYMKGTVDYESTNCEGIVHCEYKAKLTIGKDEIKCFYMNMPVCVLGVQVIFMKEYTVEDMSCD